MSSEKQSQFEYVARRMCQSRGVELVSIERSLDGGGRLRIYNGKQGGDARAAWCAVDPETLLRGRPEEVVEAVALALALGIDELQDTPTPLSIAGRFRVHFNHHGAAPLVWCVALLDREEGVAVPVWELAVHAVEIDVSVTTVYQPKATPDHEDGRPSAWLEVDGLLIVVDGAARITRRTP